MDSTRSEELIQEFSRWLGRAGVSPSAVVRYRDKLRFFLYAYLAEEWPRDLDRVESGILRDFLADWFLQNVDGSWNDLLSYLAAFRRFYEFLYETGRISGPEWEDLLGLCDDDEYFRLRWEARNAPTFDPAADLAAGRPGAAGADLFFPDRSPVTRQIFLVLNNLPPLSSPAVLDFELFLDYLDTARIRLTSAEGRIPAVHLKRINLRFSRPEKLPPRSGMNRSVRINWFFQLAQTLKLFQVQERKAFSPRPELEFFRSLEPIARLAIIINATWNLLPWALLGPPGGQRISRMAQEHRNGFAALLADLPPEREWFLSLNHHTEAADREDALLTRYLLFHQVVPSVILFALAETGLLAYTSREKKHPSPLKIRSLKLSRAGKQVFRLLARNEQARLRQDPLQRLQECLFI